jgi:hypothetical protein
VDLPAVAEPDFEQKIESKAAETVERRRKGGETVSEEACANTAKDQSENAGSAANGGK